MSIINITQDNFAAEVLQSPVPVLLDFWATWCGYCTMVSPVIDEVASEQADALKVGKINIDEQPSLAQQFAVSTIPTLMVFKGGQMTAREVGAMPKEAILDMLKR